MANPEQPLKHHVLRSNGHASQILGGNAVGEHAVVPPSKAIEVKPSTAFTEEPVGEPVIDVKTAATFLGVSCSLVYAYVERKQIPHYRMMGRAIRFRISELEAWRKQFHVNGGINE